MLSDRIKHYREAKHLTQEQLSELLFVSPGYISGLETGNRSPSLSLLLKLSGLLDCTPNDLLEFEAQTGVGDKCNDCAYKNIDNTIVQTVVMMTELGPDEKYKVYNYTKDQLQLFRCKSAN